jgi:hypothetical protein
MEGPAMTTVFEALSHESVALQGGRVLDGVFTMAFGEVNLGGFALDQPDDRGGQLLLALESADLTGRGIDLEQVFLLDEPGRAILIRKDDQVVVPIEMEFILQLRGARDVVRRIDFFHDYFLAADLLIFLEEIGNFVRLAGILLVQKGVDRDRRIELVENVDRFLRERVELRLGKVLVGVMLEADIIDHHEDEGGQDQLDDAVQAGGTTGGTGGRSIGFHGKIIPGGGVLRECSW